MVFTGQCTWRHTLVKWSCRCSKTPSGFHPMRPRAHHLRASKEMPRSRPLSNPWTSQGAEAVYFFECASGESIVSVKFFSCHCRIAFTFFWPLHFFSRKLFLGGFFFVNHRRMDRVVRYRLIGQRISDWRRVAPPPARRLSAAERANGR